MKVEGLMAFESAYDYATTVTHLDGVLASRGIVPLARIDHAAAASSVGLELPPLLLILFGNPKVGTLLMQERPTIGIDLPLKLLVWEEGGTTFVGYNEPQWFVGRHNLSASNEVATGMLHLLQALTSAVTGI